MADEAHVENPLLEFHEDPSPTLPASEEGVAGEVVFDLGRVSRRWARKWDATETEATELQLAISDFQGEIDALRDKHGEDEGAYPDEVVADLRDKVDQLLDFRKRMGALGEAQEDLIGQVVVSIPRGWCTPDCPDDVDWTASGAVGDYLQADMYRELLVQFREARSSKN